jgi:antitoxin PrlF
MLWPIMAIKVTSKGQVMLPRHVREAAGIRPGDLVEVRATAAGVVVIERAGAADDYVARLHALAERRLIRGINTEELLTMTRGDPGLDPPQGE